MGKYPRRSRRFHEVWIIPSVAFQIFPTLVASAHAGRGVTSGQIRRNPFNSDPTRDNSTWGIVADLVGFWRLSGLAVVGKYPRGCHGFHAQRLLGTEGTVPRKLFYVKTIGDFTGVCSLCSPRVICHPKT